MRLTYVHSCRHPLFLLWKYTWIPYFSSYNPFYKKWVKNLDNRYPFHHVRSWNDNVSIHIIHFNHTINSPMVEQGFSLIHSRPIWNFHRRSVTEDNQIITFPSSQRWYHLQLNRPINQKINQGINQHIWPILHQLQVQFSYLVVLREWKFRKLDNEGGWWGDSHGGIGGSIF